MKSLKAPGPDGFPTLFHKHYWDIVGDQVVLATQSFFRDGWLLRNSIKPSFLLFLRNQVLAISINSVR